MKGHEAVKRAAFVSVNECVTVFFAERAERESVLWFAPAVAAELPVLPDPPEPSHGGLSVPLTAQHTDL